MVSHLSLNFEEIPAGSWDGRDLFHFAKETIRNFGQLTWDRDDFSFFYQQGWTSAGRSVHRREECSSLGGVFIAGRSVHRWEECSSPGGMFIAGRNEECSSPGGMFIAGRNEECSSPGGMFIAGRNEECSSPGGMFIAGRSVHRLDRL
ncbi:unnamed protein product, partial [Mesorhabditis belari]|uniref:Uncharacterized protein n=1 Tax=Mesorhabditis belari TaxID=2138241 RepID=A0AAF3FR84_9BILA